MRVAALGRTRSLYETIKLLNQAGHTIVLIGTCREASEYDITSEDFEKLADELGVLFFNDVKINSPNIVSMLQKCDADIAVSVNWLTVVGKEAIDSFPLGILNAHAGNLPRFRGNATPNWAILDAESSITTTIHQMEADSLDSGDVLLKERFPISLNTRIGEVYEFLADNVPKMFVRAVNGLADGSIKPEKQSKNPSETLRCYPRIPTDSLIDWNSNASDVLRLINASSEPFSGAYTFYKMQRITIWRAEIEPFETPCRFVPGQVFSIDKEAGDVRVAAADGVIVIHEIQVKNGGRVRPASIICSARSRLGMNVEEEVYNLYKRSLGVT